MRQWIGAILDFDPSIERVVTFGPNVKVVPD